MIVKWASELVGHVGFSVSADDYDGEPSFQSFWFDSSPKSRHPDREAVAAFLVFGSYMGGHVQLPHKFSPAVDSAMRGILSPLPVVFSPVEYYPKALPDGSRVLALSWSDLVQEQTDPGDEGGAYLRIERSDKFAGALRTIRGLTIASNAWLHCRGQQGSLAEISPYVAAAVLFAEDLDADTIRLPGLHDPSSREWQELSHLLATARLGLESEWTTGSRTESVGS
jgi:hypothetical protein